MSGSPQTTHSMFPARIDAQRRLGIASFQLYPGNIRSRTSARILYRPRGTTHTATRLWPSLRHQAVRKASRPTRSSPTGRPHRSKRFFLTLVVNFHFEQAVVPIEFPNQGIRILFGDEPRSRIVQHRTVPGSGPGNLRRHDAQRPVQGNGRSSRRRRPTPNEAIELLLAKSRSDRRHRYDTRHIPKRKGPA